MKQLILDVRPIWDLLCVRMSFNTELENFEPPLTEGQCNEVERVLTEAAKVVETHLTQRNSKLIVMFGQMAWREMRSLER